MKILIITNLFPNSEEPTRGIFNKQQFVELAKLCDIKVVSPAPWHKSRCIKSEEQIAGIHTYYPRYFMTPKIFRSLYGIFMFLGIVSKIKNIKKGFSFDSILATWAYPDGFAAALLAKLLKKPLVIKVHGSDINLQTKTYIRRKLIKYALSVADKVVVVTEALKEAVVRLGINQSKVVVIQNGVDNELFKPAARHGRSGAVLFAGNLAPVKGVRYLLDAFSILLKNKPGSTLVIVGDGSQENTLKKRCGSLGIGTSVRFTGRVTHNDMAQWINDASVLCLPSINEGCPNVVLEAMACGKPIVASLVGGLCEIVGSEDIGILVKPEDPAALAAALDKALDKKWDPDRIRKEALKFSWKDGAERLQRLLDDARKAHHNKDIGNIFKNFVKSIILFLTPKSAILWRKPGSNKIALTFDDGPNANCTPKILDILNEKKVKATFFLIGKEVEKNRHIAERIVRDGHCVGMHSYLHKKNAEMAKSQDIIKRETGITSKLFRPPHGAISVSQLIYCLKNRITTVMWSINSMDYMNIRPEDVIKNSVENGISGGDVILFHDDNERTVKALPDIIDSLTLRGFRLATVEELLK